MFVLITVDSMVLFTNFSWASIAAANHHKTQYDMDSGKIDLALNLTSGYYLYNHGHL